MTYEERPVNFLIKKKKGTLGNKTISIVKVLWTKLCGRRSDLRNRSDVKKTISLVLLIFEDVKFLRGKIVIIALFCYDFLKRKE